MARRHQYKVVGSSNGFPELEKKIGIMMDNGWKPVGGIAFNMNAPYQAMARQVEVTTVREPERVQAQQPKQIPRPKTFNETLKDIDDLT